MAAIPVRYYILYRWQPNFLNPHQLVCRVLPGIAKVFIIYIYIYIKLKGMIVNGKKEKETNGTVRKKKTRPCV